jgi:hypothetical protein
MFLETGLFDEGLHAFDFLPADGGQQSLEARLLYGYVGLVLAHFDASDVSGA